MRSLTFPLTPWQTPWERTFFFFFSPPLLAFPEDTSLFLSKHQTFGDTCRSDLSLTLLAAKLPTAEVARHNVSLNCLCQQAQNGQSVTLFPSRWRDWADSLVWGLCTVRLLSMLIFTKALLTELQGNLQKETSNVSILSACQKALSQSLEKRQTHTHTYPEQFTLMDAVVCCDHATK